MPSKNTATVAADAPEQHAEMCMDTTLTTSNRLIVVRTRNSACIRAATSSQLILVTTMIDSKAAQHNCRFQAFLCSYWNEYLLFQLRNLGSSFPVLMTQTAPNRAKCGLVLRSMRAAWQGAGEPAQAASPALAPRERCEGCSRAAPRQHALTRTFAHQNVVNVGQLDALGRGTHIRCRFPQPDSPA